MTLRLGLLTTLDHNPGDNFIREGLLHVVERLLGGQAVEIVAINKHQPCSAYPSWHPLRQLFTSPLDRLPLRVLRRLQRLALRWLPARGFSRYDGCDLIFQCGTPVIWEDCRKSEWADAIWRNIFGRLAGRVPVLNLGAGSCYPCERVPQTLCGNPDEEFIRLMLRTAAVTIVRDKLSQELFASLGHDTMRLCCPAFLAAQRYTRPVGTPSRKVLINYMERGGHYDWGQRIDAEEWQQTMRAVVGDLAATGWEPLFLCHSAGEMELATRLWPALTRVHPRTSSEYFAVVRDAAFGLFNRLHAGVAAAGLGIPSVSVGTDSRLGMLETLELPCYYVKEARGAAIRAAVRQALEVRDAESRRLLALHAATLRRYEDVVRSWIARPAAPSVHP